MSNSVRHSFSLVLVLSLLVSSVGYTMISFACPMMKEKSTSCIDCKQSSKDAPGDCCKAKIERKVLRSEFEKPSEFKTTFSYLTIPVVALATECFVEISISLSQTDIIIGTPLYSVEKCAQLSTFLI